MQTFRYTTCSAETEDLRPFRIHAYSKEELAMLYNPTYCISNAIYTPVSYTHLREAVELCLYCGKCPVGI